MRRWLTLAALVTLTILPSLLLSTPAAAAHSQMEMSQLSQDYRAQGWVLEFDEDRQLPRKLVNATFREDYVGRAGGSAEEIANAFLAAHADALFGEPVDIDGANKAAGMELRTVMVRNSISGTQVKKQQFFNNVPVDGATVQTNINKVGQVLSVLSSFEPAVFMADTNPAIPASAALWVAAAHIGSSGQDRKSPDSELVILPNGAQGRLAWRTVHMLWDPYGDWESYVDARDGSVISSEDIIIYEKPKMPGLAIEPHVSRGEPANPGGSLGKVDGSGDVLPANPLNGEPSRYGLRDGDPVAGFVENKTLFRLDGTGFLRGDYADVDNSDQARANEPGLVFNYSPDVLNGAFHEVNIYWHIDTFQDYIQTTLNIPNANNESQALFAHQGEDDNSSYSPGTDTIRFGDGGVDDSEDGEVVLHEYGHAIHDDISGIGGGEAGAISEAFGDYLAATFGDNPLVAEWDATSYNPGPPPFLRRTDGPKIYPDDLVGQVHADGEIISAAWWDLRGQVGAAIADQLIIESFFLVAATTTMPDFADATVQVDQALYGGAHLGAIYNAYGSRGIGPAYLLEISHSPLGDTEDQIGPYSVDVTVAHTSPISTAPTMYHRLAGAGSFTAVPMSSTGVDAWSADIPGPGADDTIEYYVSVTDDQAVSATSPSNAPTNVHSFNVGTDAVLPVIAHTPLGDQPLLVWPAEVRAAVTDNLGVASVVCDWSLNSVPQAPFNLFAAGGDNFAADFPIAASSLQFGDIIDYSITATDGSSAANQATDGPHSFEIIDAKGVVLILDDDTSSKGGDAKQDPSDKSPIPAGVDRPDAEKGASAAQMSADLTAAGYVVTVEDPTTSDPGTWGSYNALISSSGRSNETMSDAAYRTALSNYVAGGGKLLVEGGEVGYDAIVSPGYPEIEAILHADTWSGDDSGELQGVPAQSGHPIRNLPHSLPSTIDITYDANFGDMDSCVPTSDAYVVYGNDDEPGNAGILVYDDNAAPASAQIVYMANAYSQITDTALAADLLENILEFLLAEEGGANSSISGTVDLAGTADNSGVTVTASPGGVSTVTGPDGSYTLPGLFDGAYTVTATAPAGWESGSQNVTLGSNEDLTGVDFALRQVTVVTYCNNTATPIPDANPAGTTSVIVVPDMGEIADVEVSVDISHTWIGDLLVEVSSPSSTTVTLHANTGGSADNIVTSYDDLTAPAIGTMGDFNGEDAVGTWTLFASDAVSADTGTINEWCITLTIIEDEVVPTLVSSLRAEVDGTGVAVTWDAQRSARLEGFHVMRQVGDAPVQTLTQSPLAADAKMAFRDAAVGVELDALVTYRLQAVYTDGGTELVSETQLKYSPRVVFALDQNYPNPFNPETTIAFSLPQPGRTTVRIYDVAGRLVKELVNEDLAAAARHEFSWNGRDDRGQGVASGTYYVDVRSGRFQSTKRMTLVK